MQNKTSQLLLIHYITAIVSMKENEAFTAEQIRTSSGFNNLKKSGENKNMIIIGNRTYFDELNKVLKSVNVTELQCLEILEATRMKGGKAIFLRYRNNVFNDRMIFKRTTNVGEFYTGLAEYPYLFEAIKLLYDNARGDMLTYGDIKNTINEIRRMEHIDKFLKSEWNELASKYNIASLLNKKVKKLV